MGKLSTSTGDRRISEPSTVCFREDIKAALHFSIHSIATISQGPGCAAIIFALVPPFFRQPFQGGKKNGKIDGESATFYKQKDAKHANFDKKQQNKNTYKHLQNSSTNKNVMLQLLLFLNMENSVDFELRLGFEQNSWLSSIQSASAEGSCLAHVVTFSKPRSPKMCWVRMGKVCHQNLLSQISYFTSSFQKNTYIESQTLSNTKKQHQWTWWNPSILNLLELSYPFRKNDWKNWGSISSTHIIHGTIVYLPTLIP